MDHNTLAALSLDPSPSTSPTTPAPSATARRLVAASVSPNTRDSYHRAVRQFDAWRGRCPLDDATLAAYLADLYDAGRHGARTCLEASLLGWRPHRLDNGDWGSLYLDDTSGLPAELVAARITVQPKQGPS